MGRGAPRWVLLALGATPDPLTGMVTASNESTLRRVLAQVNPADLQRLTAQWAQATARATRAGPHDGAVGGGAVGDREVGDCEVGDCEVGDEGAVAVVLTQAVA